MATLVDQNYKNYDKLSRYSYLPYFYNKNTNKYNFVTGAWLDNTTPYQNYVIQKNDTLDTLSLRAYGSPLYYWIIASFNRINDPFQELKEGIVIKIPSKSTIVFED